MSTVTSTSVSIADSTALALPEIEQPFVGQWNRLVSTTNWEKGRIIHEWREALIVVGAASADYADEAWSRRVGGITSQHVGRLRRVYQRFANTYENFQGLYWSHFQAAIDWDDAEMWLEGAVQNRWSVSAMRRTRWETLGGLPADEPREQEIAAAEMDEDFVSTAGDQRSTAGDRPHHDDGMPIPEGPDFGDEDQVHGRGDNDSPPVAIPDGQEPVVPVRPFENLAELPSDLADAFDAFKLAILRHKAEGWQQISCADVLASLDSLKELALAP